MFQAQIQFQSGGSCLRGGAAVLVPVPDPLPKWCSLSMGGRSKSSSSSRSSSSCHVNAYDELYITVYVYIFICIHLFQDISGSVNVDCTSVQVVEMVFTESPENPRCPPSKWEQTLSWNSPPAICPQRPVHIRNMVQMSSECGQREMVIGCHRLSDFRD